MAVISLFGCGLVARPFLRYFNRLGVQQIIATRSPAKVGAVVKLLKRPELVEIVSFDVQKDTHKLTSVVSRSDAVVSALPASLHYPVLQECVKQRISAITPSIAADANVGYLDQSAKLAGVLLLTECGQSPGLDHMDTARLAARVHAVGGKVRGYTSLTGSLATADGIRNPLKTKLTWSPRDWLMHSWHPARYLKNGAPVEVQWNELFLTENLGSDDYPSLNKVAWFLNRDTVKHLELYGLKDVQNAKRGVHDYPAAMPFLRALQQLRLTSAKPLEGISQLSHVEVCQRVLKTNKVKDTIQKMLGNCDGLNADEIVDMLDFLGLFSDNKVPQGAKCPLEVVAAALHNVVIKAGETDCAVNRQIMQVEKPDGTREEWRSKIEVYGECLGEEDDSAAAKLTGLTMAVAGRLLLEKKFHLAGVHVPLLPQLYEPILSGLSELGITCQDTVH